MRDGPTSAKVCTRHESNPNKDAALGVGMYKHVFSLSLLISFILQLVHLLPI